MYDPMAWTWNGVPGTAFLWLATVISFGLFGTRVWRYVKVLQSARPENRFDQLPRRLGLFAKHVLLQPRLLNERGIGAAHLVIFWAFVVYATSFFWNLVRGLIPAIGMPYAQEAWIVEALLVGFGVLGLIGLAIAAVRRYIVRPERLEQSRDACVILSLIALVLLTELGAAWERVRGAESAATVLYWAHILTVLGFLAYLPYSKHLHLLASPFSSLFANLKPGAMPPVSEGAAKREEFTWRELFGGFACAECGRCDRVCPALGSGAPLSPKNLMHVMKEAARAKADGLKVTGERVSRAEIWACATCASCMEQCPVFNEHIPVIIEMRRYLVAQGELDGKLQEAFTGLGRYGNAFGASPRNRAKWTAGLDFKIKDARKEEVEYLWFTGDTAALDPRAMPATQALARLLQRAQVDFGILYEGEVNAGNDARRAGEEGLFEALVEKNMKAIEKARFKWIVTGDPHSYHALKHEYPNGFGPKVLHATELIGQLSRAGHLPLRHTLHEGVTYHDPCYLGRYNGVYDAPRKAIEDTGAHFKEMPRRREASFCCGAGGGRIWMEDEAAEGERPAIQRVKEAAALDGVSVLAVSCPKDAVMFQDAIKTAGLESRLKVKDVVELVEAATSPTERSAIHAG